MNYKTGLAFKKIVLFLTVVCMALVTGGSYRSQAITKNERRLVTNIPAINRLFVGRQEHLQKLQEKLNRPRAVAIVGMAGMGKTQLAKQYAHTYANLYDVIWWIDANQDLSSQVRELGQKLHSLHGCIMPGSQERTLKAWLQAMASCQEEHPSKMLLIIDDVKGEEFIKMMRENIMSAHFLLTSRNQSIGENSMCLKCFTPEESIAYLTKRLPEHSHDREALNKLRGALNDYPLALAQASSYIKAFPSLSIEDYLQLYQKKRNVLWEKEEKLSPREDEENYRRTISSTFTLLLEHIIEASPHAYELLKLSSFLGNQDIPKRFLRAWMVDHKRLSEFEFHEAASTLIKHSIFEKNEDERSEERYTIHALLHEFIRDTLPDNTKESYLKEAISLLSSFLPESSYRIWEILSDDRTLEFHLDFLLNVAEIYGLQTEKFLDLKIKHLHFIHFFKFDYENAVKKAEEIEKKQEKLKNCSPLTMGRLLGIAGNLATTRWGYDKAISLSEEAVETLASLSSLEAKEELFFTLVNNLMDFYTMKGNLKKTQETSDKAERLLPFIKQPTYLALFYFMQSFYFFNQGKYAEALKYINISIEKFPSTTLPEHFHIFNKIIKAEMLARLGELDAAIELLEENYRDLNKFYPNESNYKLLRVETIKSLILLKQEKVEDALGLIKPTINKLEILFKKPDENPIQGFAHLILGEAYEKQNNLIQALSEYKKAEEIYSHIYATVEVDDMSYLYKNLAILGEKLRDDFITHTYFQLLLKYFGRDHFRTQEVVDYLEAKNRQVPWNKL